MSLPRLWQNTRPTWRSISSRPHETGNAGVVHGVALALHGVLAAGVVTAIAWALIGCTAAIPGNAASVVKIGLVAPFEGLCRSEGYELLPIVRQKLELANREGRFGAYRVALVAVNDDCAQDESLRRVEELALDPDVMVVLGVWDAAAEFAVEEARTANWPTVLGAASAPADAEMPSLCASVEEMARIIWTRAAETESAGAPSSALHISADPLGEALARSAPSNTPILADDADPEPGQTVISALSADDAADHVLRWRSRGWTGRLIGGPDLVKPWFEARASEEGEGSLALVCGDVPDGEEPAVVLARIGAERILAALADDIRLHGTPTRLGVAQSLGTTPAPVGSTWQTLSGGNWETIP